MGDMCVNPMLTHRQCWVSYKFENEVKTSYEYVLDFRNRIEETCELARVY